MGKIAWRIVKNPDSLLSLVLVSKYCKNHSFLEAAVTSVASWGWSILWGRELLQKVLKWRLGNGESIGVFRDEWIPGVSNPFRGTCAGQSFTDFRVVDLFDKHFRRWREPLISVIFPNDVVPRILSLYFPVNEMEDDLIWEQTGGVFSVKSAHLEVQFPLSF